MNFVNIKIKFSKIKCPFLDNILWPKSQRPPLVFRLAYLIVSKTIDECFNPCHSASYFLLEQNGLSMNFHSLAIVGIRI